MNCSWQTSHMGYYCKAVDDVISKTPVAPSNVWKGVENESKIDLFRHFFKLTNKY